MQAEVREGLSAVASNWHGQLRQALALALPSDDLFTTYDLMQALLELDSDEYLDEAS